MASHGQNKGFHVLEELNCEAIHAPSIQLTNSSSRGKNPGMNVLEDVVFEGNKDRPSLPLGSDVSLDPMINSLANYIAASSNPREALAHVLQLLVAK